MLKSLRSASLFVGLILMGGLLVSCGGGETSFSPFILKETWFNRGFADSNLNSLAFWAPQEWLLVTAKSTHEIVAFSAEKGKRLYRFGVQNIQEKEAVNKTEMGKAGFPIRDIYTEVGALSEISQQMFTQGLDQISPYLSE